MAASPRYKIYTESGEYIGSMKYASDAAAMVCVLGGGTVRDGHRKKDIVWNEGNEDFTACESYDGAADIIIQRVERRWMNSRLKALMEGDLE